MLTAITIENFKGISEPVRLELRPITLLFGQNSAGKSSLLHALIYAREVFERHNLDADRTLSAGEHLDLGGFLTLVHNHDRGRTIRFVFDLDLKDVDLPGAWDPVVDREDEDSEFAHLSNRVKCACVGVAVSWSELEEKPYVSEYEVAFSGQRFARIVCDAPGKGARIVDLEENHPIFHIFPADSLPGAEPDPFFLHLLDDVRHFLTPVGEPGAIGVLEQSDALPDLHRTSPLGCFVSIAVQSGAADDDAQGEESADDRWWKVHQPRLQLVERILYALLVGPGVLLRDVLSQFRYIGPQRQVPPRDYSPPQLFNSTRWATGMAGWDLLFSQPKLLDRISRLLSDPQRLNLGYTLEQVEFREFESRGRLLVALQTNQIDDLEDVSGWLKKSKTRKRLLFRPTDAPEVTLEPADLGVGVSQMIPALAAALDDQVLGRAALPVQLVAVEHPELNLHPRLQAEVADVFLEGALAEATKGRIFFIETHSEVFTLRLFRRVRDSHRRSNGPASGEGRGETGPDVHPDQIAVWYVDREEGQVTIRRIELDKKGDLIDPWPDTIFDQDFYERFA
jgi:hypothetical protein